MQTVRVDREGEFSDRDLYRENPLKTDKIAFSIFDFEPWQALPMRRHLHSDAVLLVVRGQGTMFIDDDRFSLEQGEAVYVPAGARYGILAGENDMVVAASLGPKPVETEFDRGLVYRCPACDLETPVSVSTADRADLVCPRCSARLRLRKEGDTFRAEEIGAPELTGAGAATSGPEAASDVAEMVGPRRGEPGAGAEAVPQGERREAAGETSAESEAKPAKIAFSVYDFQPWQVLPMHLNPGSDTILYVARGQGIMYLNDEERSVDEDMAVYVPAGATYGMIAGDNEMTAVALQCPVPVEARAFENLGYNCPVCDLGTPVTTNTYDGCVTVCPRCNAKLKLTKADECFEAQETDEPAPASAETT